MKCCPKSGTVLGWWLIGTLRLWKISGLKGRELWGLAVREADRGRAGTQARESPSGSARRAGACYLTEQTSPPSLSAAHTCGFNNHHINNSCLGKPPLPGRPRLSAASSRPAFITVLLQESPATAPGLWCCPLSPAPGRGPRGLTGGPGDPRQNTGAPRTPEQGRLLGKGRGEAQILLGSGRLSSPLICRLGRRSPLCWIVPAS